MAAVDAASRRAGGLGRDTGPRSAARFCAPPTTCSPTRSSCSPRSWCGRTASRGPTRWREAGYAKEFFRWFAEEAVRVPGDFRLSPAGDKRIIVDRQPIGVSLLITPWNFPAAMATRKLAPALAAGCTTILKPARETPLTAAYVVEVLRRVGRARAASSTSSRRCRPVRSSAKMIARPAVRKLSFTGLDRGGSRAARTLRGHRRQRLDGTRRQRAGHRASRCRPRRRRRGRAARPRCATAARPAPRPTASMSTLPARRVRRTDDRGARRDAPSGPAWTATNRAGRAGLRRRARQGRRDSSTPPSRKVPPSFVGGQASTSGAFYDATLLTGVQHGSTINATEIFGPVTAIVKYDDVDEAVRMANDTIYGLMAYVFGEEREAISRGTPARGRHGRRQPRRGERPGRTLRRRQAERARSRG